MTITAQIPTDIETQTRENASLGNTETFRHLLLDALDLTVESLTKPNPQLSVDELNTLADEMAKELPLRSRRNLRATAIALITLHLYSIIWSNLMSGAVNTLLCKSPICPALTGWALVFSHASNLPSRRRSFFSVNILFTFAGR